MPIPTELDPGPPPVTLTDNSLALFSLVIKREGLATGQSVTFRNGIFYQGTIVASADPDSSKLTGILNSVYEERVAQDEDTTFFYQYDANGQFVNAKIVANRNVTSSAANRIRGRASLTYRTNAPDPNCDPLNPPPTGCTSDPAGNSGGPIEYKVIGFKQSETS